MRPRIALGLLLGAMLLGAMSRMLYTAADPLIRVIPVGFSPVTLVVDGPAERALIPDAVGGHVHVVDTRTGSIVATVTVGANPLGVVPLSVAIDARSNHAFLLSQDGIVYLLDARTGGTLHETVLGRPTGLNAAYVAVDSHYERVLAINATAGLVSMLDARSGALVRTVRVDGVPTVTIDDQLGLVAVAFVTNRAQVRIFDVHTGHEVATRSPSVCYSGRSSSDNMHIGANGKDALHLSTPAYATDAAAGTWSLLDQRPGILHCTILYGRTTCPCWANREIQIGLAGGFAVDPPTHHLFFLDPVHARVHVADEQGATLHTVQVTAHPIALAVDSRHHHLLIVSTGGLDVSNYPTGYGILSVLDTRSGAVLRSHRVGVAPSGIAVDKRSGLAFVLNSYSNPDGTLAQLHDENPDLVDRLRSLLPWLPFRQQPLPTGGSSLMVLDTSRL